VVVDGLGRDEQPGRDLGVGVASADHLEDLMLAESQSQWIGPGRTARPGRDRPDAELAHLPPGDPGRSQGAQLSEEG
jgi:hypothetical protein